MGLAAIVPLVWQVIKKPKLLQKYWKLAVPISLVFFVAELIGVKFGYWIFPGNDYLSKITLLNQTFPVEEIIFWMLLYPAAIASYYEWYIDDQK